MAFDPNGYIPRVLLTLVALQISIGPFAADWNETHIHNPNWPGHARYHNGQTMSMGVCLALATLWKTFWDDRDNLLTASVCASLYAVTAFSGYFYPGSTPFDPPEDYPVAWPQLWIIVVPELTMVGLAYWLERGRVGKLKAMKKA